MTDDMNIIEHYRGAKKVILSDELVETLQELVQRLAPLAGAFAPTASLRVTPIVALSTAVTGPITNAQFVATHVVGGIHYDQRVAILNNTAIQSNIINVVITV